MDAKESKEYYRNQIDASFLLKLRHIISDDFYTPYSVPLLCSHTGMSKNVFYRLQRGTESSNIELASAFETCDKLGLSLYDFAKTELKEKMLTSWLKKLHENGCIEYHQIEKILAFSNVSTEYRVEAIVASEPEEPESSR